MERKKSEIPTIKVPGSTPATSADFAAALVRTKVPVSVFTTAGTKLQGVVVRAGQGFLVLRGEASGDQKVFFHAISTIIPQSPHHFEFE